MSWLDAHAPSRACDWGGIALGGLLALSLLVVLILGHYLDRGDRGEL